MKYLLKDDINEILQKNINNPNLYTVIGHLFGDGGYKCQSVYYANKDLYLVKNFKRKFHNIFGKGYVANIRYRKIGMMYIIRFYGRHICNFLDNFNLDEVLNKSRNCKIAFLKSIFDDEGSISRLGIISICNKNEMLIKVIKKLLGDIGINKISSKCYFHKYNKCFYYYLFLSKTQNNIFFCNISFMQKKKLKLLKENKFVVKKN